jgi:hypothetical protein
MMGAAASTNGANTTLQVLAVIGPILGVLLGAAATRWADTRNKRREHYGEAVRVLVRWSEYPYRIRRRTSNAPEEFARLAELGHELQEQLQCHRTWVQAESQRVGKLYAEAIAAIKERTALATAEAWRAEPVRDGDGMVLNGWGPDSIEDVLTKLDNAIASRFGWRRLVVETAGLPRIAPWQKQRRARVRAADSR